MVSRFVARRQNNGEYCVWDKEPDAVAQTANSQTRYENLGFNQAIDSAVELNGPGRAAEPISAPSRKVAQQQQQPQPENIDKKE
jgi:hypothetical protein